MRRKRLSLFNNSEIACFDNEKNSNISLFFIHGNSLNASLFQNQLNNPVLNQYRIVAPDLPGHGNSANSENPQRDYGVLNFISILRELIQKLNLNNIVLIGHSLGGHIAIHLLPALLKTGLQIKGLALFGTPPLTLPPALEKAFLPNPAMGLAFKPDLSSDEIQMLSKAFINDKIPQFEQVKSAIRTTDPLARAYIGQSIATEINESEVDILHNADIPLAIFHGKDDALVNPDYIKEQKFDLWNGDIQLIEQAGHLPFVEQPKIFNAQLHQFLNFVTE
ncbi:MAG: alpha/beta fold hydrolase [Thiohalospira sp.]